MLSAAIRSKYTGRSFGRFIPKSPPVFDASKQITVYTFEDEVRSRQSLRSGVIASAVVGSLALSFNYFVQSSAGAKILCLLSALFLAGAPRTARSSVTAIYLQSNGSTIHLHTEKLPGQKPPEPIVMNIEDITSEQFSAGYYLYWHSRHFTLDSNGRIPEPYLLYAILRGLPIEVAQGDGRKQ